MLNLLCGECGGEMHQFENERLNAQWIVKKDSWRCNRCRRVVEKTRAPLGVEYR